MRVTANMFVSQLEAESTSLQTQEATTEGEIASGLKLTNPSDDPGAYAQSSQLVAANSQDNEYLSVNSAAQSTAQATYSGMTSLQTVMTDVSEVMSEVSSGGNATDYKDYGTQLANDANQILQIINQKSGGSYLFGSTGDQPPLVQTGVQSTQVFGSGAAGTTLGSSFTAGTITVDGNTVTIGSGDTISTIAANIESAASGVTATVTNGMLTLTSSSPITVADGTSNFVSLSGLSTPYYQLNTTSSGYNSGVSQATINQNLTINVGLTAGSNTSGASNNFPGILTDGTATDVYTLVSNASKDLLSATTGSDPFAADSFLGNGLSSAVTTVNSGLSRVSEYLGRASAQLTQLTANQNDLNGILTNQGTNLTNLTAANTAEEATNLTQIQTAYQAALESGSKILNLSLLNYIQ